jgi:hypothetical protein
MIRSESITLIREKSQEGKNAYAIAKGIPSLHNQRDIIMLFLPSYR